MSGYLLFDLGGHELAAPLSEVREVLRAERLDVLPGLVAPVTGLMHLRGRPLPVCDLRRGADRASGSAGDVVLLAREDGSPLGVLVDRVRAVVEADALVGADGSGDGAGAWAVPAGLPPYVIGVLRRADPPVGSAVGTSGSTVFLVALSRLVDDLAAVTAVAQT